MKELTNIQNKQRHINNFSRLGEVLSAYLNHHKINSNYHKILNNAILKSIQHNPFFTEENILYALKSISDILKKNKIETWLKKYDFSINNEKKRIGVVLPGNIPIVGFHDFLCVLITENIFVGKLSHNDKFLLPAIAEILMDIDSYYREKIFLTEGFLKNYDAVIATGSNNSSRYFEYYFRNVPHIIRKNRNSIAILTGNETDEELRKLADDIFLFFGLGCRNVSKVFVPERYDFSRLIKMSEKYSHYFNHHKYRNNFDYYRTIFTMNSKKFIDGLFFTLCEDTSLYSPVSVVNYEFYTSSKEVHDFVELKKEELQCIVAQKAEYPRFVYFGQTQSPQLDDYADEIDTIEFLLKNL